MRLFKWIGWKVGRGVVRVGNRFSDLEEEGVLGPEDAAGPDKADPGDVLAREEVLQRVGVGLGAAVG
jgi:hypothetical protein